MDQAKPKTLCDLIADKGPFIDVDAHASIADALTVMRDHKVSALVVAGEQGHWLGAGASCVTIANSAKQLLGIVTILDVILHLANSVKLSLEGNTVTSIMHATRIVDILGQNTESLSLWVADPSLELKLALEPLAKGVHRVLVPIYASNESAHHHHQPPISFKMCTQSDVIRFFLPLLTTDPAFSHLAHLPLSALTLPTVPSVVTRADPVMPALVRLAVQNRGAVPVVDRTGVLADTLSTSDFRALLWEKNAGHVAVEAVVTAMVGGMSVGDFLELLQEREGPARRVLKGVVSGSTRFVEAVRIVCENRIHRLWIVDGEGIPTGVVSLTDMIRCIRKM
ncbi:hypothetical protein BC830DRAFT_1174004 [Chytriomyces sp. MP71]|nr:hypothetical protein BC830DRAFT_1174004 [Chytriomyces sp. MP71]